MLSTILNGVRLAILSVLKKYIQMFNPEIETQDSGFFLRNANSLLNRIISSKVTFCKNELT